MPDFGHAYVFMLLENAIFFWFAYTAFPATCVVAFPTADSATYGNMIADFYASFDFA